MIVGRPFEEFDFSNELRLEPAAFLHVLGRQAFAPSALTRFEKTPKRGLGDQQTFKIREERPPRSWAKTVPNAARVHQITSPVIPDQDRVEGCEPGRYPPITNS